MLLTMTILTLMMMILMLKMMMKMLMMTTIIIIIRKRTRSIIGQRNVDCHLWKASYSFTHGLWLGTFSGALVEPSVGRFRIVSLYQDHDGYDISVKFFK